MSRLFSPLSLGALELSNRIIIAPMCQYSATDGVMSDWHLMHLGNLALSGASLLIIEATGVVPEGRITPYCTGLYSDANEAAMARVVNFVRSISPIKIGLQLAHAGRKASAQRPWEGRGSLTTKEEGAWPTVAPSAIPFAPGWPTPAALNRDGMERVKLAFVNAAHRASRIGIDVLDMHSVHGYLLHEFLSPLSNRRTDEYGGSLENRMRFPLEVFGALRSAWPGKPLGAKIPGSDFYVGGWSPEDAVVYAGALKAAGCDFVIVSGGGTVLDTTVPVAPGYQVPFAAQIKRETGIITGAVGLIGDPRQAESILAEAQADCIALARGMLFEPRWGWHAAIELGAHLEYPSKYHRCHPDIWPLGPTLGRVEQG